VTVQAYNAKGDELAEGSFTISDNGMVDKRGLKTKTGTYTYSKPAGSRVIPVRVR
jgi:hypothetical protein